MPGETLGCFLRQGDSKVTAVPERHRPARHSVVLLSTCLIPNDRERHVSNRDTCSSSAEPSCLKTLHRHNLVAFALLYLSAMMNESLKTKTTAPCPKARRAFVRRQTCRSFAIISFITTMLSVSCLMNGTCAKSAFTTVRNALRTVHTLSLASGRDPAMMRVNPKVHSVLDLSSIDEAVKHELALGLVTRTRDFSRGVDARNVVRVQELGLDYGLILPASLSPASDAGGISAQILDRSMTSFFNIASIKNSFVGRTAETVEKKMKTEIALGGSEPDSIQHNLKFQMKASEARASMEYRGITNADLSYSIASRKTNLEIYEKLTNGSNLVYTHSDEPSDRRDVVSLRLHW
ncbi:hypothetical protein BH10BDE1_BH10BDE1_34380 [soil metagenome]